MWIKISQHGMAAMYLLHFLEAREHYLMEVKWYILDQFANPLILPKPDDKLPWWYLCEKKAI